MAYEIKIIGEQNPVTLSNEDGLKVKVLFENKQTPNDTPVNLGDVLSTKKGQIRSIRKVEDSASSNKNINAVASDTNKLEREIYLSWKSKTPDMKSERLELFKQCYRAIHNQFPSEEVLSGLKAELVSFFRENPNRTYGDPKIYINHFGVGAEKLKISTFKFSILKLLERVIVNDMLTVK